ncbi:hypothetical protein PV11_09343 [Exophiala sideris]|uniref:Uncharacterized protein n=1 Tax=Exophiala sideris TaxID=1016849 RepID=A0A0D1YRK7_9EURO|nr:hypothetical protein PV11_09343 [Exophiala sideris]
MASSSSSHGLDSGECRSRSAPEQGMLLAFLHTETCVLDFILLGCAVQRQASRNRDAVEKTVYDVHRIHSLSDNVSALMESMDALTDARMIREALVYRSTLVD